ncbi:MAG: hypothetical protein KKA60_15020 [Proteobacteria bacterium]|nr:hypothetical protein [Pseudomonadota bacterium]
MLQIDFFLSYGFASSLAIAARKKLVQEKSPWVNKYFLTTLLWLTLAFAPQVTYLMWKFPAWETMFVAGGYDDIPAWLVAGTSVGMVLMGILGFFITFDLLKQGRMGFAAAQVICSVALSLFLSTYGWDGTGYKRMLYAGTAQDWLQGVVYPVTAFPTSAVGLSLIWLEGLLVIPYAVFLGLWIKESRMETQL